MLHQLHKLEPLSCQVDVGCACFLGNVEAKVHLLGLVGLTGALQGVLGVHARLELVKEGGVDLNFGKVDCTLLDEVVGVQHGRTNLAVLGVGTVALHGVLAHFGACDPLGCSRHDFEHVHFAFAVKAHDAPGCERTGYRERFGAFAEDACLQLTVREEDCVHRGSHVEGLARHGRKLVQFDLDFGGVVQTEEFAHLGRLGGSLDCDWDAAIRLVCHHLLLSHHRQSLDLRGLRQCPRLQPVVSAHLIELVLLVYGVVAFF
mmetsp:Transcript_77974/g.168669  ORF Transcript_77974/g.168669 Transcript_77974/m.168669 type:complete len:260 (-) Transcript_77974:502-1281(-)